MHLLRCSISPLHPHQQPWCAVFCHPIHCLSGGHGEGKSMTLHMIQFILDLINGTNLNTTSTSRDILFSFLSDPASTSCTFTADAYIEHESHRYLLRSTIQCTMPHGISRHPRFHILHETITDDSISSQTTHRSVYDPFLKEDCSMAFLFFKKTSIPTQAFLSSAPLLDLFTQPVPTSILQTVCPRIQSLQFEPSPILQWVDQPEPLHFINKAELAAFLSFGTLRSLAVLTAADTLKDTGGILLLDDAEELSSPVLSALLQQFQSSPHHCLLIFASRHPDLPVFQQANIRPLMVQTF